MHGIRNAKKLGVYLDGAANTPLDWKVAKAMEPYLGGFCGNSNSVHKYGQVADAAVDKSRQTISARLGCEKDELYFTSGATESNNWVIKGLALAELAKPKAERRTRIICLSHEHSSVLSSCMALKKYGFKIDLVDPIGDIGSFPAFCAAMAKNKSDLLLVCSMAVNNETGQVFPAEAIARYALEICDAPTLVDCTQALSCGGAEETNLRKRFPHAAYLTFSGHKVYGPTGIGCLVVNKGVLNGRNIPPIPLISGGSQEAGVRGGTTNTAAIIGLAKAIDLIATTSYNALFKQLKKDTITEIEKLNAWAATTLFPSDGRNIVFLNKNAGVNHILNINCGDLVDLPNLADVLSARGVAVSAGAACSVTGDETELSHVLSALKIDERGIRNSVRVSFTKYTTKKDIQKFFSVLRGVILENYSPRVWDGKKARKNGRKQKNEKGVTNG